jgi:hypothetical protein
MLLKAPVVTILVLLQVRVAAAQARVQLCTPTLASILSAANLAAPPSTTPKSEDTEAVIHEDAGFLEEKDARSNKSKSVVLGGMEAEDSSSCHLAQAAALSAAAKLLNELHTAHRNLQEARAAAGRKCTAVDAGLELGEDGEPPLSAATVLSPMLSMHTVPALRHEAFRVLNASAGQEPSLICFADVAHSDITASGLAARAPFSSPLATSRPQETRSTTSVGKQAPALLYFAPCGGCPALFQLRWQPISSRSFVFHDESVTP